MQQFVGELAALADRMDEATLEPVVAAIVDARRVMLYGCGREGLMMRALAMRLHHLGREVCMQGDMTAFPLARGDLFLCAAGPGALSTASALCG
jgi:6-phospho-3-hexuloisomerase